MKLHFSVIKLNVEKDVASIWQVVNNRFVNKSVYYGLLLKCLGKKIKSKISWLFFWCLFWSSSAGLPKNAANHYTSVIQA